MSVTQADVDKPYLARSTEDFAGKREEAKPKDNEEGGMDARADR